MIGYKNCGEQKTISVTIIKEEEKERALMDLVGATSHVYGVQRTNSDASLLYSCDYDISKKLSMDNKNLLGICCDHVIVKSRKKVVEMVPTIVSQQNVTEKKPIPSLGNPKKSTVESFFSKQKLPKSQSNNSDDTDSGFNELKCSSETTKSGAASHFKNHSKTKDSRDANFGNGDAIAEPEQARVQASNKSTKLSVKKNSTSRKSQLVQKGKRKRVLESSESDGNDSFEELDQSMDMFESTSPRMQSFSKPTSDEKSQNSSDVLSTHCSNQDTKENQSLNCGTNMMKVTAVKTYVDSEDEGFMITERVLEVVQVPNQGKQNAPDIKMKLTETKPEVSHHDVIYYG